MPELKSAAEATEIAVEFAKRYKALVTPLGAHRDDGNWVVELDLGLFRVIKGQVRIDADTGTILDYLFPE